MTTSAAPTTMRASVLRPLVEPSATPPADGASCDDVVVPAQFAHPVPDGLSDAEMARTGAVDLDSTVTARYDLDHVEEAPLSDDDPRGLEAVVDLAGGPPGSGGAGSGGAAATSGSAA